MVATRVNATTIRKDIKVNKDLSRVEYYSYHKKGHYANKYLNKQVKTSISFGNLYVNGCS